MFKNQPFGQRIALFLQQPWLLWIVYGIVAIALSAQRLAMAKSTAVWTAYENYRIFKYSWIHLMNGQNPYVGFPEVWDLYKYSPLFAIFMAPFASLPDWAGLAIWNLINVSVLLYAILSMPLFEQRQRIFIAWFVLPELVISVQNSQSNALTVALMILVFNTLHQKKEKLSALFAIFGGFIKVFGIFAAILVLYYPGQRRSFIQWLLLWGGLGLVIPAFFVGWQHNTQVHIWWWELLQQDHSNSVGLSVSGWLQAWFGFVPPKTAITIAGLATLLLATFVASKRGDSALPALGNLLIWVVIFNHKAESPTFIIAMCGAAIWYQSLEKKTLATTLLLWTAFVFASLSPTDLFPAGLRTTLVERYVLKAAPLIAIWGLVTYQMLFGTKRKLVK